MHIGDLIILADDRAIADGLEWKLVDAMRAELDVKYEAFRTAVLAANSGGIAYNQRVKQKKQFAKDAKKATRKLNIYIENAFFADAKDIVHRLLLDQKFPIDDEKLALYLSSVRTALTNHDNATYPLPASFTGPVYTACDDFGKAHIDVNDFYEDRRTAIQTRKHALAEFKTLLGPIRMWLWNMLPDGRSDTRLIDYGFTPYGTHHVKKDEPPDEGIAVVDDIDWN